MSQPISSLPPEERRKATSDLLRDALDVPDRQWRYNKAAGDNTPNEMELRIEVRSGEEAKKAEVSLSNEMKRIGLDDKVSVTYLAESTEAGMKAQPYLVISIKDDKDLDTTLDRIERAAPQLERIIDQNSTRTMADRAAEAAEERVEKPRGGSGIDLIGDVGRFIPGVGGYRARQVEDLASRGAAAIGRAEDEEAEPREAAAPSTVDLAGGPKPKTAPAADAEKPDAKSTAASPEISTDNMRTLLDTAKRDGTKVEFGNGGADGVFDVGTQGGTPGKFTVNAEALALTAQYPDQVVYKDAATGLQAQAANDYLKTNDAAARAKAEAERDAGITAEPAAPVTNVAAAVDAGTAAVDTAAPAKPAAKPLEGRNAEISALAKDSNTVLNSLGNQDVQAAMADLDGKAGFTIDDVYAFQKLGKADAAKVAAIAGILSKSGTTAPEPETEKPSAEPLAPSASPVQRPGQGVGLIER